MKVYLTFLLGVTVVFALAASAILFFTGFTRQPESHTAPDAVVVIHGQPVTCAGLFHQTCSFDLQSEFNQWGHGLESFVDSGALGPYAREIRFTAAAKLSLQACGINNTAGRTVLDFYDLARVDQPTATTTDLFPFWNESLQFLCPTM